MSIGSRLRDAREKKGHPLDQMAGALHMDAATLKAYEGDEIRPSDDVLFQIANYLGIDANYIFQDYMKPSLSVKPPKPGDFSGFGKAIEDLYAQDFTTPSN